MVYRYPLLSDLVDCCFIDDVEDIRVLLDAPGQHRGRIWPRFVQWGCRERLLRGKLRSDHTLGNAGFGIPGMGDEYIVSPRAGAAGGGGGGGGGGDGGDGGVAPEQLRLGLRTATTTADDWSIIDGALTTLIDLFERSFVSILDGTITLADFERFNGHPHRVEIIKAWSWLGHDDVAAVLGREAEAVATCGKSLDDMLSVSRLFFNGSRFQGT